MNGFSAFFSSSTSYFLSFFSFKFLFSVKFSTRSLISPLTFVRFYSHLNRVFALEDSGLVDLPFVDSTRVVDFENFCDY